MEPDMERRGDLTIADVTHLVLFVTACALAVANIYVLYVDFDVRMHEYPADGCRHERHDHGLVVADGDTVYSSDSIDFAHTISSTEDRSSVVSDTIDDNDASWLTVDTAHTSDNIDDSISEGDESQSSGKPKPALSDVVSQWSVVWKIIRVGLDLLLAAS
eukprot:scpid94313/ scgid7333/ 